MWDVIVHGVNVGENCSWCGCRGSCLFMIVHGVGMGADHGVEGELIVHGMGGGGANCSWYWWRGADCS